VKDKDFLKLFEQAMVSMDKCKDECDKSCLSLLSTKEENKASQQAKTEELRKLHFESSMNQLLSILVLGDLTKHFELSHRSKEAMLDALAENDKDLLKRIPKDQRDFSDVASLLDNELMRIDETLEPSNESKNCKELLELFSSYFKDKALTREDFLFKLGFILGKSCERLHTLEYEKETVNGYKNKAGGKSGGSKTAEKIRIERKRIELALESLLYFPPTKTIERNLLKYKKVCRGFTHALDKRNKLDVYISQQLIKIDKFKIDKISPNTLSSNKISKHTSNSYLNIINSWLNE
jgi:hypothetical protein